MTLEQHNAIAVLADLLAKEAGNGDEENISGLIYALNRVTEEEK